MNVTLLLNFSMIIAEIKFVLLFFIINTITICIYAFSCIVSSIIILILLNNYDLSNSLLVTEGVYLYNCGIDPYTGDLFHETPIGLYVFNFIQQHLSQWILFCLFVFTDLLTAVFLGLTAKQYATELVS